MPKHINRCPEHFEIDCYTGCPFGCLYCVERAAQNPVSAPVPDIDTLMDSLFRSNPDNRPVYLSPKTDAYQPLEKSSRITRAIVERLSASDTTFFVITKSPLVLRDAALFRSKEAFIAISLNTTDDSLAALTEPDTPPPSQRMRLVEELVKDRAIRTVVKIDPILPGLTDGERLNNLLQWLSRVKPFAVTAETARINNTILKQLKRGLPKNEYDRLATFYPDTGGEPQHPSLSKRLPLFQQIATTLEDAGVPVSFCRASLPEPLTDRDCRGGFG